MKDYFRVMLGRGSMYAEVCRQQGFIGAHFGIAQDLTNFLGGEQRQFTQQIRPIYQEVFPEKSNPRVDGVCSVPPPTPPEKYPWPPPAVL